MLGGKGALARTSDPDMRLDPYCWGNDVWVTCEPVVSMCRDFLKTLGRSDEYVLTDKGTVLSMIVPQPSRNAV